MPHAEKRDGKLTGFWYGEVDLRHKGGERLRRRFETKAKAEGLLEYPMLHLFPHKNSPAAVEGRFPAAISCFAFRTVLLLGIVQTLNLRRADTRGGSLAFALIAFLSARAGAQTHCQAPPEAAPALAATDGRVRLESGIDQRLAREAHRMSWWNYGWAIGIGASGAGTLVAVPFVSPENRVDYYTGAVMAGAGVIPFLVAPPNVIHDGKQLHAKLQTFPPRPTATRSARSSRTPSRAWCATRATSGCSPAGGRMPPTSPSTPPASSSSASATTTGSRAPSTAVPVS